VVEVIWSVEPNEIRIEDAAEKVFSHWQRSEDLTRGKWNMQEETDLGLHDNINIVRQDDELLL